MSTAVIDIHKLLDIDPLNGKPVIRGTRLRVLTLAARHLEGRSPEDIASSYPGLSLPAVFAALAYYYEHRDQLDRDEASEERDVRAEAEARGSEPI